MADTQNGVLSTPTLQDLFTLMEKRRSELKRLKEGRLKADNLVRRARSSFSVGSGTPAAVCPQDEFNTPFHDVKAGSSRDQVGMLDRRTIGSRFIVKGGWRDPCCTTSHHGLIVHGGVTCLYCCPSPPPRTPVLGFLQDT